MKYTVAVIATFAAVAMAQIGDIPACAQSCLLSGIQATGCALTDFKCSCSNTAFVTSSGTCIASACTGDDITKAIKAAAGICASVGITIPTTLPGSGAASSSVAASSSSAAAPSTTASSSAAAPSTSTSTLATTAASSAAASTTTAAVTSSVVVVTPPSVNSTVSVSPPSVTGAAGSFVAPGALAAIGAVAAFFF